MTTKQLINKLKKLPEDAEITVHNTDAFILGEYYTSGIDILIGNDGKTFVCINANYDKAVWTRRTPSICEEIKR